MLESYSNLVESIIKNLKKSGWIEIKKPKSGK